MDQYEFLKLARRKMQGGTLDRWRKLFQSQPTAISDELNDEFVSADELESWVHGTPEDMDASASTRDLKNYQDEVNSSRSQKIIPETRVVSHAPKRNSLVHNGEIRSALGPGTLIEGKFSFDSPVRIDGTIRGEVHSTSVLMIGEDGVVEGLMCVGSLIVLGRAKGTIVCDETVQIGSSGEVKGDIEGGLLAIELGGKFEGAKKGRLA